MPNGDSAHDILLEVIAAETAEERQRKRSVEQKAATLATSSATLGASAIALGGLLYKASFTYTLGRSISLSGIIALYLIALVLALVALSLGRYPKISVADIRGFETYANGDAEAAASKVFDAYATYLGTLAGRNDRKTSWLIASVFLNALAVAATLVSGLLLATGVI